MQQLNKKMIQHLDMKNTQSNVWILLCKKIGNYAAFSYKFNDN